MQEKGLLLREKSGRINASQKLRQMYHPSERKRLMYIRKTASPAPYDSLWEALELGKKMPKKPFRIAAVGSGGKTTLLYTLAREARERGLSVLLLPRLICSFRKRTACLPEGQRM